MNLNFEVVKKTFHILLCVSNLAFLASCKGPDPIDISIDTPAPKLVVASQIIPNQVMIVSLTKSFSALSSETKGDSIPNNFLSDVLVKDAVVTVSYLSQTDTLTMITPGIYASINTLQYDYGVYTLKAKDIHSDMQISASSTILPLVPFDTIYPAVQVDNGHASVSLNYSFTDIPEVDNYYVINYYKKISDTTGHGFDINNYFTIGSNKLL